MTDSAITIPRDIVRELIHEDVGGECQGYKVIEQGEWVDEGKHAYKATIFEHDSKTYRLWCSRARLYSSDYYYQWEDDEEFVCNEVKPQEKVVTEWVEVEE